MSPPPSADEQHDKGKGLHKEFVCMRDVHPAVG